MHRVYHEEQSGQHFVHLVLAMDDRLEAEMIVEDFGRRLRHEPVTKAMADLIRRRRTHNRTQTRLY
jgi:hypothetical protein